jgi:DNA polymerase III delta prime subunit
VETPIGHSKQRALFTGLVQQDKLPSTLLFAGIRGIGKSLVARELARHLLCQNSAQAATGGCGSCRTCTLVDAHNHPDLHTLSFGEAGATVDDVRRTLERLSLKAFMSGRKVAIFDDVDNISLVGSNIILKSLEEPRPETFFILVASTPSRLPQTLLSRCQKWFFDRLSPQEVQEILTRRGDGEASEALALAADGSVASLETMKARAEMLDVIRSTLDLAFKGDDSKITKAAQEWGADKTGIRDRLTFLRTLIRERLLSSHNDLNASAVWAHALQNALDIEYLVLDRHVNPTLSLLTLLRDCNHSNAPIYRQLPHSAPTIMERLIGN